MKVELYHFQSASENWRYTSADRNIAHGPNTYIAVPGLSRGNLRSMGSIHKADLEITAPRDNDLVALFMGARPESIVSASIFEADYPVTEVNLIWKGRIVGVGLKDSTAAIACESIFTSLGRPGLRAMYQIICRHGLYQPGCNLSAEAWRVTAAITAYDGNTLTVPAAAGFADGYFANGYLTFQGQYVMIATHAGKTLVTDRRITGYGQAYLYPGCDHLMATCHQKFNNILNYGGFPMTPGRTPFSGGQAFIAGPNASPHAQF